MRILLQRWISTESLPNLPCQINTGLKQGTHMTIFGILIGQIETRDYFHHSHWSFALVGGLGRIGQARVRSPTSDWYRCITS